MLSLPKELRTLREEDKISMGHARALMNTANPIELAQEVLRKGLNVRQTEKLAHAEKNPNVTPRAQKTVTVTTVEHNAQLTSASDNSAQANGYKDPDIMALEDTLSENLGLKVSIIDRGQSGQIAISYESLEQLDEILRRLGGSI